MSSTTVETETVESTKNIEKGDIVWVLAHHVSTEKAKRVFKTEYKTAKVYGSVNNIVMEREIGKKRGTKKVFVTYVENFVIIAAMST